MRQWACIRKFDGESVIINTGLPDLAYRGEIRWETTSLPISGNMSVVTTWSKRESTPLILSWWRSIDSIQRPRHSISSTTPQSIYLMAGFFSQLKVIGQIPSQSDPACPAQCRVFVSLTRNLCDSEGMLDDRLVGANSGDLSVFPPRRDESRQLLAFQLPIAFKLTFEHTHFCFIRLR